jgi:hypothetical protein
MRNTGFLLISLILCVNLLSIHVQSQEQSPKVDLDCSFSSSAPFDNTYGIGMGYHTPIECNIDNPSSYTVELEISWEWQWNVELLDSEGENMEENQQLNANDNLIFFLETDSPRHQEIGDYEIQISAIVTRYGLGQDAMYDCSDCEEESTTEVITSHPFYDYSHELIDNSSGWDMEEWTYLIWTEYFETYHLMFPDCPNDIFWQEYQFSIQANHDGYFTIDQWMGEVHEVWLLDSNGEKSTPFSEIRYETGELITFKLHISWDMNEINETLMSETWSSYYQYSVYLWWSGDAYMDNEQYSAVKTYHPNHKISYLSDDYPIWRDISYSGSGGELQERDTMPCVIGEIVEYEAPIIILDEGEDYQLSSLSMISTVMIISLCALFVKERK